MSRNEKDSFGSLISTIFWLFVLWMLAPILGKVLFVVVCILAEIFNR